MSLGGSPRASIALFRTAQALAAVSGRNFVRPDDVKQMAGAVLTHRLILRPESRLRKSRPPPSWPKWSPTARADALKRGGG